MRFLEIALATLWLASSSATSPVADSSSPQQNKHLRPVVEKRQQFEKGEPIDDKGKGAPILGEL